MHEHKTSPAHSVSTSPFFQSTALRFYFDKLSQFCCSCKCTQHMYQVGDNFIRKTPGKGL